MREERKEGEEKEGEREGEKEGEKEGDGCDNEDNNLEDLESLRLNYARMNTRRATNFSQVEDIDQDKDYE